MTLVVETACYGRASESLWRDTGGHVLVLPTGTGRDGEVVVLGGGGAAVWRLLERPLDVPELMERFADEGGAPSDVTELLQCLSHLAECGVLTVGPAQ